MERKIEKWRQASAETPSSASEHRETTADSRVQTVSFSVAHVCVVVSMFANRSAPTRIGVRATPSAVETIETLLGELIPRGKKGSSRHRSANGDGGEDDQKRIKEARQCFFCGKMFASAEYLEKHRLRRHLGEDNELKLNDVQHTKPPRQQMVHENARNASTDNSGSGDKALRQMLQQVEHAFQDHQESLRALAKEEAVKIQNLYEQLHVENQLAEEIKASRLHAAKQVEEAQQQLDTILQEKDDALTELNDLKEQIQFLDLKRKMEMQAGVRTSSMPASSAEADISTTLEITRLEQALDMVNAALKGSREELGRLQETHLAALKEKQVLADRLDESQTHVKRLECKISEICGAQKVPVTRKDCGSQTMLAEPCDVETQATAKSASTSEPVKEEMATQTNPEVKAPGIDIAIQTIPDEQFHPAAVPLSELEADRNEQTSTASATRTSLGETALEAESGSTLVSQHSITPSTQDPDYAFKMVAESVMDAVAARANRYKRLFIGFRVTTSYWN